MKVMIDRDGCISCGLCAGTCPEVFQMGGWWYLVFSTFSDRFTTHYRMARTLDGPWGIPTDARWPLSTSRTEGGQRPEADHGAGTGYGPDPPPAGKKIKIL